MNSFPLRKFAAVSFCKISLKVLLPRLLLGSLLFAVGCDAWLFFLLAILPQTSQLSVNGCAILTNWLLHYFLGWRRVCLLQKSQQSVFSSLVSIPYSQGPHSHILMTGGSDGFFWVWHFGQKGFFGSMKDAGIFLGRENNTGIFLGVVFFISSNQT